MIAMIPVCVFAFAGGLAFASLVHDAMAVRPALREIARQRQHAAIMEGGAI